MSKEIFASETGTDERWGELWITNLTTGAGGFPSVNGNSFFAEIPALAGQTNTLHVAIPDRAGNMGYATKDFFVGTANGTNETKTYASDEAGCLTNLNGVSLEWDERYRLKNVDGASCSVVYEYDVLDRRISRIEGGTTNFFVYEGQQVVADLDGNGDLLRTYVWGMGIDNLLAMTVHGATATNTYYPIKDHQNTILALANSSGAIVESYEYDAWGNTRVFDATGSELTESTYGNRYCFQGREIDWSTGLHYFRARWYNPDTGRWLSKDPIGISGGLNQYVFCANNPVNFVDPLGLDEDAWYKKSWNWLKGRNWSEVGRGTKGMLKASVQILIGAAITQGDTAFPGVLDVVGAGVVVEGIGDMSLNYGIVVGALSGADTSDIPDDTLNAAVDAFTGSDEAGDIAQDVFDTGVDGLGEL